MVPNPGRRVAAGVFHSCQKIRPLRPIRPIRPMLSFQEFFAQHFAPQLAAEQARDAQHRDEAFVNCTHTVCDLELRPMTPYDLLLMQGCGNPFIAGGVLTPEAIAQFLAILAEPAPRGWWERRRFFRRIAAQPYGQAVAQIRAYLTRTFYASGIASSDQSDPSDQSDQTDRTTQTPAALCVIAPLIASIACETGWAESELMAMPLAKLFQYRRAIAEAKGGQEFYAPADKIISRALEAYGRYTAGQWPSPAPGASQSPLPTKDQSDPSDPSNPSDSSR